MGFVSDLASNILGSALFWLLAGLAFWWLSRPVQRRFIRFFELRGPGEMVVYLSNTWRPDDTGRRQVGFAATKHELLATQTIANLLSSAPARMPELVRGLVDALWLRAQIRYRLEVSSPAVDGLEPSACAIVLGSAFRNSVRRHYLHEGVAKAMLDRETPEGAGIGPDEVKEILIQQNAGEMKVVDSRLNLAILEKVVLPERGKALFFCVGARSDSTWGAAEYLVRHWRRLEREFGSSPFVVCLAFAKPETYPDAYSEPVTLVALRT